MPIKGYLKKATRLIISFSSNTIIMLLDILPKEFFTKESILTLLGAASATLIVCNALRRSINFSPKWLALIIALLISFAGAIESTAGSLLDYLLAFVNGCLIFCTAVGMNEGASNINIPESPHRGIVKPHTSYGKLSTSWFNKK
jgi:hypothetical protein